jgi:hypothetical protein
VDTGKTENVCEGCERFLVVEAVMDDPDDYQYTLDELNEGYPAELRARFLGHDVWIDGWEAALAAVKGGSDELQG